MPSRWQKLKSTLASYYREYEFVTAIYVLEPWEKRWANGVVAVTLAIFIFSAVHYLPHYTATLFEYFNTNSKNKMIKGGEKQLTQKNNPEDRDSDMINDKNCDEMTHESSLIGNLTKEDIFKRLDKRKEILEQQRSAHLNERSKTAAENNAVLDKLNEWSKSILARIDDLNTSDTKTDSDGTSEKNSSENHVVVLNSLSEEIQKFDSFFSEKSHDLSQYDVRQTQAVTVQIKEKFVTLQDNLKPKKKFGFKSKHKKNASRKPVGSDKDSKITILASQDKNTLNEGKESAFNTGAYEITNTNDSSIIEVPAQDVETRDVVMNRLRSDNFLEKVTVKILGSPGTVHATNMDNVTVLCGPVRTSIFIENCTNCEFVVACQQLRIHTTRNSNFYLHVTSKGIIEDCHSVGFAPYNLSYPKLDEQFSNSGLSHEINHWNEIDDFNWLSKEKISPHWHIISEAERKTNWLL